MKVKIEKCSWGDLSWYNNRIGEVFNVIACEITGWFAVDQDEKDVNLYIYKDDCSVINDEESL